MGLRVGLGVGIEHGAEGLATLALGSVPQDAARVLSGAASLLAGLADGLCVGM